MSYADKDRYGYYKDRGICTCCKKSKAIKGRVLCLECREENRIRSKNYTLKNYARVTEYRTILDTACKANGICIKCRKETVSGNHVCCDGCLEQRRNKYALKKVKKYKDDTMCVLCYAQRHGEYKLCETHLASILKAGKVSLEKKKLNVELGITKHTHDKARKTNEHKKN
jgi:hypothetical protein